MGSMNIYFGGIFLILALQLNQVEFELTRALSLTNCKIDAPNVALCQAFVMSEMSEKWDNFYLFSQLFVLGFMAIHSTVQIIQKCIRANNARNATNANAESTSPFVYHSTPVDSSFSFSAPSASTPLITK